jgi:hypothetical protein
VRCFVLLLLAACSSPEPSTDEGKLRKKLGVPQDARTVVVFAQAAHLDIDWQKTFDDYYHAWVQDIFVEARQILDGQKRARYSVAEMGYLARHVSEHPEELAALQQHARGGELRIVGGGMTSPDTLLPETELLMRDFLYGSKFADETLGARASAAWLPDSFGHAATAPDVLAACGFDSVGFARVDGAPTFFEVVKGLTALKPASTAEQLQQLGSADFIWRGSGGASVLGHYVASGFYCTGDNIDYDEPFPLPGGHVGVYMGDQPEFTDGKIDSYIAALAPYAKTPYLFVPIGCDFQHPKEELLDYLDGYNKRRYPSTGAFAVAAPFDDYAALVATHRDELPELDGELSPYFMGFYGTRAGVKRAVRDAAAPFFAAEPLAVALGQGAPDAASLTRLTLADHHDFVTGTANDAVANGEQLPLLDTARTAGESALANLASQVAAKLPAATGTPLVVFNPSSVAASAVLDVPSMATPMHASNAQVESHAGGLRVAIDSLPPLGWRAIDLQPGAALPPARVTATVSATRVVMSNEHVRAQLDLAAGRFALTSLTVDGAEALAGRSFTVAAWADQGGLWRLGQEMNNCTFVQMSPAAVSETARIADQSLLSATVVITAPDATRELRLDAGARGLQLALTTSAPVATTRTASFRFAAAAPLRSGLAGGFAERTVERVYTPTFWPAVDWVSAGGWAILLRQSTGVRFAADGTVELMAVRNAQGEQCDYEGGTGTDGDMHRIEWMIVPAPAPPDAMRAAQIFDRPPRFYVAPSGGTGDFAGEFSLASADGDGLITALKPAERGDGVILRALLLPGPLTIHLAAPLAALARTRTDAVERDLEPLDAPSDTMVLDAARFGPIATVRLH